MNHDILARLYYSSVYPSIGGFVWDPPNPVASCEFQPVWFKNQAQLSTHLWRTCLQRIFQVFLQLMAITLCMLVEIARSSFTGRGDPSELCSCTSLPTKTNYDKQQSNDKASNYIKQNSHKLNFQVTRFPRICDP